jgi:hypothetical protein
MIGRGLTFIVLIFVIFGAVMVAQHSGHVDAKEGRSGLFASAIDRTWRAGQCDKGFCWICKTQVDLDQVTINVDTNDVREDAVKFAPGCTGTIRSLTITTRSGDGLKIAEGAHDLTIPSGSIRCLDKTDVVHQDGLQAMGGSNITFGDSFSDPFKIDCGRTGDNLIDANWRVAKAGNSTTSPDQIVCDNCYLGGNTAHTVTLQESTNSGVKNSTICPGKFPKLTYTVGPDAVNPVGPDGVGNIFPEAC